MRHDALLRFATNERPRLSILGALVAGGFYPFPRFGFPAGDSGVATSFDMKSAIDKGSGYPLLARMDVITTFTSTDAALTARFGVAVSDDPGFAGTDQLILAVGEALTLAELAAGRFYEVTVPKLSSIHSIGRRFMFTGLLISSTIALGVELFTAGGADAFLVLDSDAAPRTPPYASGWNAKGA